MSKHTELIVALVGGAGTDFEKISTFIKGILDPYFSVSEIKLSSLPEKYFNTEKTFKGKGVLDRIHFYQDLCDKYAKINCAIMAMLAMIEIRKQRNPDKCNVYIINSLKREDEFKALRRVYGQNLILISIYEPKARRFEHLIQQEEIENGTPTEKTKKKLEHIIDRDKENKEISHGQAVRNTYIHASYFIRFDSYHEEINRLFNVLRGDPIITPTKDELAMAQAYVMAMRSADLNRQVGAVIADDDGNIIASGCNEVPKFNGGLCWPTDISDLRDYFHTAENGVPSSIKIKTEIAENIVKIIKETLNSRIKIDHKLTKQLVDVLLKKGEIKDLLEYLRPVHAEEAAICDAALRGVSTKGKTLYCNTYPCHLCAKKIIAAGIKRVVYIDPYPKSKAEELFQGIMIDKPINERDSKEKVVFDSFTGFSPKRYSYMFNLKYKTRVDERTKRVIPRESLNFPQDIIYVSNYTPLGYLMKEEAYIYWLLQNSQDLNEERNNFELKFIEYKNLFNEETKWMER